MTSATTPTASAGAGNGEWVVRWRPVPGARLRLFCLPHSGAGAAAYRPWARALSDVAADIEVVAVQLPGRETRLREQPLTRIADLAPALVRGVQPWLDRPHAWFGHSLGALVAFEACRTMRRLAIAEPLRLLVSGRPAPHLPEPSRPSLHDAPTPKLLEWLQAMSGTPPELLHDPSVLRAFLPALRADLAMLDSYHWRPEPPLDCPISVFGGAEDSTASPDQLHAWRRHSRVESTVRLLPGGHFFLHDAPERILPAIAADVLSVLRAPATGLPDVIERSEW